MLFQKYMSNDIYKYVLNGVKDGVYYVDKNRKITFWNKSAERITGFGFEEVIDHYCYDNILNHVDPEGNALCHNGCPLHQTLEDGKERTGTVFLQHKDGYRVETTVYIVPIIEDGEIIGAVETFDEKLDLSEVEKNMEKLRNLAYYDQLTGLPNRRYLDEHLELKLKAFEKMHLAFGIAVFDIDHFKHINDTYGHDVGDDILKGLGTMLKQAMRGDDFVARWGGEEFVAVLNLENLDELKGLSERLRFLVEHSGFRKYDPTIHITISVGGTLATSQDTVASMFKRADEMLYKSKTTGRNCVNVI
jgi:diguanylate cyclase (GGDEF)-like protein/PAS domain S-box-containing protein